MAILLALLLASGVQETGASRKVLDLIERLGSDSAEERERATAALQALANEALPELRKAARERSGEIAARAAAVVHGIEVQNLLTPRLKEHFPKLEKDLLEKSREAWWSVFCILKNDDEEEYEDLTAGERGRIHEKALQEADRDDRRKEILQQVFSHPVSMDGAGILPLLAAPETEMRSLAAMALGRVGGKGAVAALQGRLDDEQWEVRFRAAEALGHLKAREAREALTRLLDQPPDVVGAAAATALGRMGAAESEPALRKLLKAPGPLRSAAAHALADLGVVDGPVLLGRVVEEDEFHFKVEAAERLVALGSKGVPALRACLKHSERETRALAIESLAKLGSREDIPAIAALLADAFPGLRASAAEALADLGARDQAGALLKLLEDGEWTVRKAAGEALGHLGVREAIPELRKVLKDPAPYVQFASASSLCVLGDDSGVTLLLRESKDRYDSVREAIALTSLNALREPALWKRLSAKPLVAAVEGRVPKVLQALASASALKLELGHPDAELDEASAPWLQRRLSIPARRGSLLEAIRSLRGKGACDFIFDAGTLRVVSHSEAIKFWTDWQASREKK